eukprot:c7446_g1_i2.p1 GENE.c7446_g1_i2~~c7446_g1_i2.p1  ORF type:complete len:154 (-),score=47.56 c7446_g1_i2:60-521(-)
MDQLTHEQIREFREAFQLFDKDNSGAIDQKELATVLRSLGQNPRPEELKEMIKTVDKKGTGLIDFSGFLEMMAKKLMDTNLEQEMVLAFRIFDEDDKGYVTCQELRHVMTSMKIMTDEEFDELVKVADEDHNGKINYVRFVKILIGEIEIETS